MAMPAAFQLADDSADFAHHQRRQSFGRLVQQQERRIHQQRATDGQHLLLAAAQRIAADYAGAPANVGNSSYTRSRVHGAAFALGEDQIFSHDSGAKMRRPCGTSPTPSAAIAYGGRRVTSRPSKMIRPRAAD